MFCATYGHVDKNPQTSRLVSGRKFVSLLMQLEDTKMRGPSAKTARPKANIRYFKEEGNLLSREYSPMPR